MLESLKARIRKRRQGIGMPRLLLYVFVYLLRKASFGTVGLDYRYILIQPVADEPLLRGRALRGIEMRTLTGADLRRAYEEDEGGAFSREPRDDARFYRRADRGDVCFAAYRGSRAEGVLWLSFGRYDEPDVKADFLVRPAFGMAWDSNLYIVDDARGGMLFAALWDAANAWLRQHGFHCIATQTSAFNGPSLQAHSRMGARRIARMIYFLCGPLHLTLTSLRPRVALLGPKASSPVYEIPAVAGENGGERGASQAHAAPRH